MGMGCSSESVDVGNPIQTTTAQVQAKALEDEVCMEVNPAEPWVRPFDRYDVRGLSEPDGKITGRDIESWFHTNSSLSRDYSALLAKHGCALFRWDMKRYQYLWEFARPELERDRPLEDAERRLKAMKALDRLADFIIQMMTDAMKYGKGLPDDEAASLGRASLEINHQMRAAHHEIELSLHLEKAALSGVGFGFSKEPGRPAVIERIEPGSPLVVDGKKMEILEIDGVDVRPMESFEVRNAARGPFGSDVSLTIRDLDTGARKVVKLKRTWKPSHLQ